MRMRRICIRDMAGVRRGVVGDGVGRGVGEAWRELLSSLLIFFLRRGYTVFLTFEMAMRYGTVTSYDLWLFFSSKVLKHEWFERHVDVI